MTLPCIRCDAPLENALPEGLDDNQPLDGCCFWTHGHYGCAVFDPLDGSKLEINICDPCLAMAIRKGTAAPPKRSNGDGM